MNSDYLIVFRVWPFSTGAGQAEDYRVCGPKRREFKVKAHSFEDAQAAALNIRRGIVSSGHVWNAPLESISLLTPRQLATAPQTGPASEGAGQ
jgi:hypothetical protein